MAYDEPVFRGLRRHGAPSGSGVTVTREQWIADAVGLIRPDFKDRGFILPEVRVTIGFTSKGVRSKAVGQCWYPGSVGDGVHELYIVPTISDGARALDILVHELVHVAVGAEAKHGPKFRELATDLGLEGKMTATVAGPEMDARARRVLGELGEYPHKGLTPALSSVGPKQGTRMLKVQCPDCDYTVRTTRKWLDLGLPTCVCGTKMVDVSGL